MVRGKRPLAMSENWDFLTHNETFDAEGKPREVYRALFDRLNEMPRTQVRALDDQLEATMREMGVTFFGVNPLKSDILPPKPGNFCGPRCLFTRTAKHSRRGS